MTKFFNSLITFFDAHGNPTAINPRHIVMVKATLSTPGDDMGTVIYLTGNKFVAVDKPIDVVMGLLEKGHEVSAYYNEIDPHAASWLRNLIAEGHIASGDVDERSIVDVRAADLVGYRQCHFFAGIGGWSLALRLADWSDDKPVWTGSCPCQPFSVAGERKGFDDGRHLWPAFHALVADCRPAVVFGEQVAEELGSGGSPLYALTWKHQAMPSGPPILQLRAAACRTSDSDFTGWPTPSARDYRDLSSRGAEYAASRAGHQPSTVTTAYLRGYHSGQIPLLLARIMGFPDQWVSCAASATPSARRSQPASSAQA